MTNLKIVEILVYGDRIFESNNPEPIIVEVKGFENLKRIKFEVPSFFSIKDMLSRRKVVSSNLVMDKLMKLEELDIDGNCVIKMMNMDFVKLKNISLKNTNDELDFNKEILKNNQNDRIECLRLDKSCLKQINMAVLAKNMSKIKELTLIEKDTTTVTLGSLFNQNRDYSLKSLARVVNLCHLVKIVLNIKNNDGSFREIGSLNNLKTLEFTISKSNSVSRTDILIHDLPSIATILVSNFSCCYRVIIDDSCFHANLRSFKTYGCRYKNNLNQVIDFIFFNNYNLLKKSISLVEFVPYTCVFTENGAFNIINQSLRRLTLFHNIQMKYGLKDLKSLKELTLEFVMFFERQTLSMETIFYNLKSLVLKIGDGDVRHEEVKRISELMKLIPVKFPMINDLSVLFNEPKNFREQLTLILDSRLKKLTKIRIVSDKERTKSRMFLSGEDRSCCFLNVRIESIATLRYLEIESSENIYLLNLSGLEVLKILCSQNIDYSKINANNLGILEVSHYFKQSMVNLNNITAKIIDVKCNELFHCDMIREHLKIDKFTLNNVVSNEVEELRLTNLTLLDHQNIRILQKLRVLKIRNCRAEIGGILLMNLSQLEKFEMEFTVDNKFIELKDLPKLDSILLINGNVFNRRSHDLTLSALPLLKRIKCEQCRFFMNGLDVDRIPTSYNFDLNHESYDYHLKSGICEEKICRIVR